MTENTRPQDAQTERTLRDRLSTALAENGIGPEAPADLHSWRCEHPERYGECGCRSELLDDLVKAIAPRDEAAVKAEAWDEGLAACDDDHMSHLAHSIKIEGDSHLRFTTGPNPYRAKRDGERPFPSTEEADRG